MDGKRGAMSDVGAAASQVGVLGLIVVLGFVLTKLRYIDRDLSTRLTRLLLDVTLPCMVIASVGDVDFATVSSQLLPICALTVVMYVAMLVVSAFAAFVMRVPRDKFVTYVFMGSCTNVGFMGIPVVAAVLGEGTVIVSSVLVALYNVFNFGLNFAGLAFDQRYREIAAGKVPDERRFSIPWRSIVSPAMVSSIIAVALLFAQVRLPGVIEQSLDMLGGMTAPLSMLVVGYFLSTIKPTELVEEWRLVPFMAIRQLLGSIGLLFALAPLPFDPVLVGIVVLQFVMPTGSMVPVFVGQFGGDVKLASKGTVVSTVLSFAFIPLVLVAMAL